MRLHRSTLLAAAGFAVLISSPVLAQVTEIGDIETPLKRRFEGQRVTVKMDMPGSAEGIDVSLDKGRKINFTDYQRDLRRFGTAIHAGDSTTITLIKVKKDLIEFQLGGGGYGTFGDDTSTSSNIRMLDKSEREKDLEKRVKAETDRDRKRALERELNTLRDLRERENRLRRMESERIEAQKREELAARRLTGGSRFNLRYTDRVPADVTPATIMTALADYVDFENSTGSVTATWKPADVSVLRKGMSRAEAERAFGSPTDRKDKREGGLLTVTLTFELPDQRITADFVEDVLIRYSVSSK